MKRYTPALRRAAEVVDVPGTPRTLRLDEVHETGDTVTVRWSFVDPEVHEGRPRARLSGTATFAPQGRRGEVEVLARSWWREVQLAAGHRFKRQVDADFVPGVPPRREPWTVDEAWHALLAHLQASQPVTVEATAEGLRVVTRTAETHYRFSPHVWADYLNRVQLATSSGDDEYVVPAGVPQDGGLPIWAADDLDETAGLRGPVVTIAGGRLVSSAE